jgi:hypothetical protein
MFVQKKKKKTEPAPKTGMSTYAVVVWRRRPPGCSFLNRGLTLNGGPSDTTVMGPYFSFWHTPSKILFMALHRSQTKGREMAFSDANCMGLDILAKANYAGYEPFEIVEHLNKARGLYHLKARQPGGPNRFFETL